jgi:hypothetical protein
LNAAIGKKRGISFEDVVFCLQSGGLLDDISHPNDERYAHQRVFVVAIDDYVYLVPYVETEDEIFLKTVIPGRKATKPGRVGSFSAHPLERQMVGKR